MGINLSNWILLFWIAMFMLVPHYDDSISTWNKLQYIIDVRYNEALRVELGCITDTECVNSEENNYE